MDFPALPKRLTTACEQIISGHHKNGDVRYSRLVRALSETEVLVFVAVHEDLRALLGAATAFWRISIVLLISCAALLLLTVVLNGWIALGFLLVFGATVYCWRRTNSFYATIGAILLSLEIIANDFGDASKYLPRAHEEAVHAFEKCGMVHPRRLLNLYMPQIGGPEGAEFRTNLTELYETEAKQIA